VTSGGFAEESQSGSSRRGDRGRRSQSRYPSLAATHLTPARHYMSPPRKRGSIALSRTAAKATELVGHVLFPIPHRPLSPPRDGGGEPRTRASGDCLL